VVVVVTEIGIDEVEEVKIETVIEIKEMIIVIEKMSTSQVHQVQVEVEIEVVVVVIEENQNHHYNYQV
jgi:siroheme synthase (precorrin-2 oxidase/ferrochelatase)